ncbi:MarR family winged helix-turn-helix transcriptional regulator [Microbacterium gorillae]|uniref:MarR family winged helix-turn-helix transcriptional regulator n=1 Tax=Microbacterium gorillae TaxID=1231063 RepID=UPI003D98E222
MNALGPGRLLFGFVRYWSRRSATGNTATAQNGRLILVTEAISTLAERQVPATVNAVAAEIAIDQSGASRLIASAIDAGYVTLTSTPSDRRRREVAVTPQGRAALQEAHAWQERIFDELTAGWSTRRREDFQNAMADLIARSQAIGM